MEEQNIVENKNKLMPIGVLISNTFNLYAKFIGPILLMGLLPVVLFLVSYLFNFSWLAMIFGIILILYAWLFFPSVIFLISSERFEGSNLEFVVSAYKNSLKYFWSYIGLIISITILVWGGYLLFLIPGLYIGVAMSLAPYIFFIEKEKVRPALMKSWFYIKGNWWKIFLRYLLWGVAIIIIISAISYFANLIFSAKSLGSSLVVFAFDYLLGIPLMIVFGFEMYKDIKNLKGSPNEEQLAPFKKRVFWFSVIGIVAIIGLVLMVISFPSEFINNRPNFIY